mgnify:CR=1 FL=1
MSSRLFQEIREKRGLVYGISAFSAAYTDTGVFGIYCGTGENQIKELIPVLCNELNTSPSSISEKEINRICVNAANGELKNILSITNEPLVSVDFNHNSHSSIFDLTETQVIESQFVRVLSWYDNEWGFSNRMLDTANIMSSFI